MGLGVCTVVCWDKAERWFSSEPYMTMVDFGKKKGDNGASRVCKRVWAAIVEK